MQTTQEHYLTETDRLEAIAYGVVRLYCGQQMAEVSSEQAYGRYLYWTETVTPIMREFIRSVVEEKDIQLAFSFLDAHIARSHANAASNALRACGVQL